MSQAGSDQQRTRFRRPLGVVVMAYKAILGLSEITVGILLALGAADEVQAAGEAQQRRDLGVVLAGEELGHL